MLEVRQQIHLSFKRLLEICLDSISYRLLRSIVTVCIIVLAIAFLTVIMVEGYLGRRIRDTVLGITERYTAYSRFLSKASRVENDEGLLRFFARLVPGTADYANVRTWGGFGPEEMTAFIESCRRASDYLDFFVHIPVGHRVILVGQREGVEVFAGLQDPDAWEDFARRIAPMKNLRLPGGIEGFRSFVQGWPEFSGRLATVRRNYEATVQRIEAACGDRGISGALRAAVAAGDAEAFFAKVAALGLRVDEGQKAYIVEGVAHEEERDWAFAQLKKSPVRTGWNRQFQERFSPGEALISCVRRSGRVAWIQRVLEEGGQAEGFDAERFLRFGKEYRLRRRRLEDAKALVARYGRTKKLSEKTVWLISVSFLVCVVGIANAMLMSVLERFKEIATMKCLGARNETIAFLFVTESLIIGIVGGLAGIVLGFLIVLVRLLVGYGGLVFVHFPWADMALTFVIGFCCSLVLAIVAAIYPAWVASRMAPMEAMRVD